MPEEQKKAKDYPVGVKKSYSIPDLWKIVKKKLEEKKSAGKLHEGIYQW